MRITNGSIASFLYDVAVCVGMATFISSAAAGASGGPAGAPARPAGLVALSSAGRGNPWVNLGDGREMPISSPELMSALERYKAKPASLASGDFDGDGAQDLLVGYAGSGAGLITLFRGNLDSIFPNSSEAEARKARGAFVDSPFFAPSWISALPEAPDFLGVGDFDADGRTDVVAAARLSNALHFLRGDGHGGFGESREIPLPGRLTAFAAGEVHRPDSLTDLAVGIVADHGSMVLIFASPQGAFGGAPETLAVPGEPVAFAFGRWDDDPFEDLAVAAGRDLLIIHGRDRSLSASDPEAEGSAVRIDRLALDCAPLSMAAGRFLSPSGHRSDLALLSEDGVLRHLALQKVSDDGVERWTERRRSQVLASGHAPAAARLVELSISTLPVDDLIVTDPGGSRLVLLPGGAGDLLAGGAGDLSSRTGPVLLDTLGEPAGVLPMRLNEDALDDLVVLVQGTSLPVFAPTSPLSTFTVNVTTDTSDVFPGNGICADSVNKCSLRAAIQESNSRAGADTIQFNIGAGTPTISPTSSLPDIIDTVTINGATGGATRVQLSGASAGAGATGLYFDEGFSSTGNNSLVRSLVINSFGGTGISILTSNNRIEDCYIGTDASGGSSVAGNGGDGIHILSPTFFGRLNTIGGTAASQRNVISHNSGNGVLLDNDADTNTIAGNYIGTNASGNGANPNSGDGVVVVTDAISNTIGGATSAPGTPPGNVISGNSGNGVKTVGVASANTIQGNLIGTRADGAAALGNSLNGVLTTDGEHGDTIGGTSPSSRNVISGNAGDGVEFNGTGSGGSLRGNFIGTDSSGSAAVANGGHGVLVTAGATGSIGGTSSLTPGACTGDCNLIAFNTGAGVRVDSASSLNVAIRGNSLFANSGLGIDLGPAGVTANDPGDADTGANTLQNFPVLTSAAFGGASTTIKGTLNSTANTTFTVELYDNASADPSGNGEGKTFLGSTTVATNASGDGQFTFVASGNPSFLTATATSPDGNTSEFSAGYSNPGEASAAGTMKAVKSVGTAVTVTYSPACKASDHAIYRAAAGPAPIPGAIHWTDASCGLGVSGSASFDPGNPPAGQFFYFVVVGQTGSSEGSYGRSSAGVERPEAAGIGACDRAQMLTMVCP